VDAEDVDLVVILLISAENKLKKQQENRSEGIGVLASICVVRW
jgi:hypothetical protein